MARRNFVQAAKEPLEQLNDRIAELKEEIKATEENTEVATNRLDSLIPEYKENKTSEDKYKKAADKLNKEIKDEFKNQDITEYSAGGWKATITTAEKSDFNELQAIEILRDTLNPELFSEVVKTKEYIDNDALERMIYQKTIDATLLAPCTIVKEPTITLRISKAK